MSQAELDKIVAVGKAFTGLCPNGSFYSWGGDRLTDLSLSPRDEARFRAAQTAAVGGGANAGPGMYITTSLWDSAEYCPAVNGVLLQVDLPDGIPYIRISHQPTMNALRTGQPSINTQMLYRQMPDMPPVVVNHAGNWHCLKTCKGVGFRKFDGRGSSPLIIQQALNQLRQDQRGAAVAVLLEQLRPDIRLQVQ